MTGTSKGKGFAGCHQAPQFPHAGRHARQFAVASCPGSIGQCQTPGRVFKGKKMAGHMGAERVTTQNLEIVRVDPERNLLLIRGAVPGAPGGHVLVRPTVKS